jgi:hypothetical protein
MKRGIVVVIEKLFGRDGSVFGLYLRQLITCQMPLRITFFFKMSIATTSFTDDSSVSTIGDAMKKFDNHISYFTDCSGNTAHFYFE